MKSDLWWYWLVMLSSTTTPSPFLPPQRCSVACRPLFGRKPPLCGKCRPLPLTLFFRAERPGRIGLHLHYGPAFQFGDLLQIFQHLSPQLFAPRLLKLGRQDRKSTRLNSSHVAISYAL